MRFRFVPISLGASALLLAGCASGKDTANDDATGTTTVVATTTILGSVTGDIASCADPAATVLTLMPTGADPHDFSPSSEQVAQIVTADLVVANGLGLEAGLDDALDNAATDGATVIEVADLVDPIPFGAGGHADDEHADEEHSDEEAKDDEHADEEHSEDEHGHGSEDPHFWFDMNRMATAAEIIGSELATSTGNEDFTTCGAEVADEIRAAETDVRTLLESVPADSRILVTDHDALGYLAGTYAYEIAGTVIPAGTTLAEPSSADLADLVATIQDEGVRAIFTNTADPTQLADAVASEVGGDVQVVQLYVGSLGEEGSGAEDYISMMRTDAQRIADALGD